jgi:hypothetical protein
MGSGLFGRQKGPTYKGPKPSVKVRALHWEKIPAKIVHDTWWQQEQYSKVRQQSLRNARSA